MVYFCLPTACVWCFMPSLQKKYTNINGSDDITVYFFLKKLISRPVNLTGLKDTNEWFHFPEIVGVPAPCSSEMAGERPFQVFLHLFWLWPLTLIPLSLWNWLLCTIFFFFLWPFQRCLVFLTLRPQMEHEKILLIALSQKINPICQHRHPK